MYRNIKLANIKYGLNIALARNTMHVVRLHGAGNNKEHFVHHKPCVTTTGSIKTELQ